MGEAEWLGQGEPPAKLCHAHRHNRLDNSSERASLLVFSFSLLLSGSAFAIARLHSGPFSVFSGSSGCLTRFSASLASSYIPHLLLPFSRFLLSSLAFAPFHRRRHPLRLLHRLLFLVPSLSLLPFLFARLCVCVCVCVFARIAPPSLILCPVSFASSSHSVFHFFPAAAASGTTRVATQPR